MNPQPKKDFGKGGALETTRNRRTYEKKVQHRASTGSVPTQRPRTQKKTRKNKDGVGVNKTTFGHQLGITRKFRTKNPNLFRKPQAGEWRQSLRKRRSKRPDL